MTGHHAHLSVIQYQPGHSALKDMVEKTVKSYKKHDPKRHFFIYKPVDGTAGVAYCFVTNGKFGLLKKELGDAEAKKAVTSAQSAVKSNKGFKAKFTHHSKAHEVGKPYLAVVKVTFDPANANKIRDIAKKIESHSGTSKKHTVFTLEGVKNTFYIAFGLDNIAVMDKPGGLMKHVTDPSVKALYDEFKQSVKSMKSIKLRLLPQYSNA